MVMELQTIQRTDTPANSSLEQIVKDTPWSNEIGERYLPEISWKKEHGMAVAEVVNQLLEQTMDTYEPAMSAALRSNRKSILLAAIHHDAGITNLGIDVTDEMLKDMVNKNGRLDTQEEAVMDRHPITGAELVFPHDPIAARMIALHHTFQTRPYPNGLDQRLQTIFSKIPAGQLVMIVEASKMIALADTARAIMEPRPYSPGKPADYAQVELLKEDRWSSQQVKVAVSQSAKTLQKFGQIIN